MYYHHALARAEYQVLPSFRFCLIQHRMRSTHRQKGTAVMINWDDLKFCLALDQHGTMVNAAKSLQANVATVSSRIEHLTTDVGETLFIRNGQEWTTTGVGAELVKLATEIEARLIEMELANTEPLSNKSVVRMSVSLTILQTFMKNFASHTLTTVSHSMSI